MSLLSKLTDIRVDPDLIIVSGGTYQLLSRHGGVLATFRRNKVGGGWDFRDEEADTHWRVATMEDLVCLVANLDASY